MLVAGLGQKKGAAQGLVLENFQVLPRRGSLRQFPTLDKEHSDRQGTLLSTAHHLGSPPRAILVRTSDPYIPVIMDSGPYLHIRLQPQVGCRTT